MREEIFGPILPLLPFDALEEAISFVQDRPRSLALYLFTKSRSVEREVLARIPFGGGCVNDTVVHLSTPYLPFGGVGASGMGSYHGRASFETCLLYTSARQTGAGQNLPEAGPLAEPGPPPAPVWARSEAGSGRNMGRPSRPGPCGFRPDNTSPGPVCSS